MTTNISKACLNCYNKTILEITKKTKRKKNYKYEEFSQ